MADKDFDMPTNVGILSFLAAFWVLTALSCCFLYCYQSCRTCPRRPRPRHRSTANPPPRTSPPVGFPHRGDAIIFLGSPQTDLVGSNIAPVHHNMMGSHRGNVMGSPRGYIMGSPGRSDLVGSSDFAPVHSISHREARMALQQVPEQDQPPNYYVLLSEDLPPPSYAELFPGEQT